ncbi:MAG: protoporphyrinogen oxidase HemJ [Pseudomonadota bacterium]
MLWLKAFHIIAVICWFAGLFYLPRLFVYHVATRDDAGHERFVIMARKLYRGIMWPSMIATIALGIALLTLQWPAWQGQGWLHAKLALVVALVGYHLACGHYRQQLAERRCQKSPVFFRVFNEAPVLALIAIVILVTVKPF